MSHVYVVQRATALYQSYEDRFIDIVGVFASLEAANKAVRRCQREFMTEFKIEEGINGEDLFGFCWEDRGGYAGDGRQEHSEREGKERTRVEKPENKVDGKRGESASVTKAGGKEVGLYWEFDDGACWYSCGVECWPVLGSAA